VKVRNNSRDCDLLAPDAEDLESIVELVLSLLEICKPGKEKKIVAPETRKLMPRPSCAHHKLRTSHWLVPRPIVKTGFSMKGWFLQVSLM
jgi:hypothetical protein